MVGLAALVPLALAPGERAPELADVAFYGLSGVAAWLVWRRIDVALDRKRAALRHWGWLLLLSGAWLVRLPALQSGLVVAALLLATALAAGLTVRAFARLQPAASVLLLPWLAWLLLTAAASLHHFWLGAI